jgi:hypothetical protein
MTDGVSSSETVGSCSLTSICLRITIESNLDSRTDHRKWIECNACRDKLLCQHTSLKMRRIHRAGAGVSTDQPMVEQPHNLTLGRTLRPAFPPPHFVGWNQGMATRSGSPSLLSKLSRSSPVPAKNRACSGSIARVLYQSSSTFYSSLHGFNDL